MPNDKRKANGMQEQNDVVITPAQGASPSSFHSDISKLNDITAGKLSLYDSVMKPTYLDV